jgi:tetratricopeptide (TPR) repeat protein
MEVNPLFAPALLQLALIDFRKNDLLETVCKADDILYGLYPDRDTKDRTLDLLQDVYESRIDRGNTNFQQRKNYYKAIDEFEEARRICEKYSTIRCSDELYQGIKLSKNGIYRDHLESARLLIQSNDLTKAEKRVKDAINYQYQNSKDILNNTEAIALLKGIQQKRYASLITKGKNFIDQRLYEAALTTFSEATEMKNENDLVEDPNFGNLVNSAARPRIIELFYEGEALVRVNDLGAAGDRYKKASDLQLQYGFSNDKDINKHRELLRKSIFSKECINAQESVDKAFKEGQANVDVANYIAARNQFELAIKTADDFANCGIDITDVKSANVAIRPAATYLALFSDFKIKEENGDYREAIDLYNKATRYFMENKVASFGIVHELDKFTYIKEKGTGGLINYAAEMYTEQDDLDKGLILYKLLLSRNYDVKLLEGSLYTIGYKYGLKEKNANPGFKAKELVKQYTSNDKKMKRFEKGFAKGYKN